MVVGYVRLSRDDNKRNYTSIENQKLIIQQYALKDNLIVERWYEDDGISGYSFDRPGFNQMISDLEVDVDTIVTKDFSRIGRHNAKVLLLLEDIKKKGKRLIAINDDYDTFEDEDEALGIKTWYNERYVKDTSKKIKRSIGAKQQDGTLIVNVPFGYKRNIKSKKVIEIVENEAEIIKTIYQYYIDGYGFRKIAVLLTEENIKTPSMCIRDRYIEEGKIYKKNVTTKWSDSMVGDILKDDFYIGTLRLHKRERVLINGTDLRVEGDKQIVFENNHQPIITIEDYNLVQELRKKRIRTNYRGQRSMINIFGDCLVCKDCGGRLTPISRRSEGNTRRYYICNTYNSKGKRYCNYAHIIREEELISDVIKYIKMCRNSFKEVIDQYDFTSLSIEKGKVNKTRNKLENQLEKKKEELRSSILLKITDMATNSSNKTIIEDTYKELQETLICEISSIEDKLEKLKEVTLEKNNVINRFKSALDIVDDIISKENIERSDIEALISKIVIDKDGLPEIQLKYGMSSLVNYSPIEELNAEEDKIILEILRIIEEEERGYTSVKSLLRKLDECSIKRSKNTLLPYINYMIEVGILSKTDDKLKPYQIMSTKEEIKNRIESYIVSMQSRWHASDGS